MLVTVSYYQIFCKSIYLFNYCISIFIIEFIVFEVALHRCLENLIEENLNYYNEKKQSTKQGYLQHIGTLYDKRRISKKKTTIKNNKDAEPKSKNNKRGLSFSQIIEGPNDLNRQKEQKDIMINSHRNINSIREEPNEETPKQTPSSITSRQDIKKKFQQKKLSTFSQSFVKKHSIRTKYRQDSVKKNNQIEEVAEEQIQDEFKSFYLDQIDQPDQWIDQEDKSSAIEDIVQKQIQLIKSQKSLYTMKKDNEKQKRYYKQHLMIYDYNEQKAFENDMKSYVQAQFNQKRENLNIDKKLLSKITCLIIIGILLELSFGLLSIVVYTTTQLKTPEGTLTILYVSSVLEFLSLFVALRLFQDISAKEIDNLILVKKFGDKNSKIQNEYLFKIPDAYLEDDPTKNVFTSRINKK